jgi:hypothetical protein
MRNVLKAMVLVAAGLVASIFAAPQASAASTGTLPISLKGVIADTTLGSFVEQARYGRRARIRRRCRRRWGGGYRYRRCLRRQGYYARGHRYRRCRRVNRRCRYRFGYGYRYRRCMRNRGCRRFY